MEILKAIRLMFISVHPALLVFNHFTLSYDDIICYIFILLLYSNLCYSF